MIPQIKHLLICPFVFSKFEPFSQRSKKPTQANQPVQVGSREEALPLMIPGFNKNSDVAKFFEVCTPGRAEIETAPGVRVDRPGTLAGSGFPSLCHPSQV